ncbi:nck-associated protein 1 homolog [Dendronephthya gigantea]|uniref:nck-associated protein 1 homolog n=1 Tax=Dendronephthya gigantea TaxID=151771 RepID=UPI001069F654|nr:nck-associated protein 1 homolog [Dendronephthya gigantea]
MNRGLSAGEQKLAEKLIILNERGKGMLTRIYNIKKQCSDPKSRPAFLSDKPLEGTIKTIVRKFPNFESHLKGQTQPIQGQEKDIVKGLSNYYYTFVDVMQFKDHTSELLTMIDASFVHFDIALNFDLTRAYLDLIVTYVSLMLLIARVDDRKAVLGLFNYAYEAQNGRSDEYFPRLGQLIIDYEYPLKRLSEDFTTHQQRVSQALQSVHNIYHRRNHTGAQWRQSQLLSIISAPATMLEPAQSEVVACEYLPLSTMNKWILFCYCLCYNHINDPGAIEVWKAALGDGFCLSLCRDEVYMVHKEFHSFFDALKGQSKRAKEIQECGSLALSNSPGIHRERRNYLRAAMQELSHIISDQPGLFGPKALVVVQALSLASDEVHWLVRHKEHNPPKGKKNPDDYTDTRLSHMLFLIEELHAMMLKYSSVLQRYYIQYMSGFDNSLLKDILQKIAIVPEDVSLLMTSFTTTLASLSVKQVESNTEFDFDGLRLDWIRLQAYTSIRGAAPEIKDIRDMAMLLNTISFHSKLVDNQEGLLSEVADLTLFCFYPNSLVEEAFHQCLTSLGQQKFSIAFPLLCSHFMSATNPFCPEERHLLGERSLSAVNMFLDAIAKQAKEVVQLYCKEHLKLFYQLDPLNALHLLEDAAAAKKKDKNKKNQQPQMPKPGEESFRKTRESLTQLDAKLLALSDLSVALNYVSHIQVWEHNFAPKEFLAVHLEDFFSKSVVKLTGYDSDKQEINRPSELLNNVKVLMGVLRCVENYANVDMSRICNHAMLQQTQPVDSHGGITVCGMYSQWYVDILLRQVSTGNLLYSPNRKSFITKTATTNFKADEFTDPVELRALATLLGPYGMKYLGDRMLQQIASQMGEVKKLVKNNKDVLASLRNSFDKHEQSLELVRRLKNTDDLLIRMTIVGVILAFRELTQEALRDVLEKRVPFLVCYVNDFQENYRKENEHRVLVDDMAISAGYKCDIDRPLCNAMRQHKEKKLEEDIQIWSLLLVFLGVCIPFQANKDECEYNPNLEAHENNFHCLAKAIDRISVALCSNNGDNIEVRLREFLVIASSSLLKLGLESEKDMPKNRESVYLLLDMIIQESPFLTMDILESCFPYSLLRNAYHQVYKKPRAGKKARSAVTTAVEDSSVL